MLLLLGFRPTTAFWTESVLLISSLCFICNYTQCLYLADTVNCNYPQFCGHVQIPFPFSTDKSCALSPHFHLICTKNASLSKDNYPYLAVGSRNLQVLSISEDNLLVNVTEIKVMVDCANVNVTQNQSFILDPFPSPFAMSGENFFTVFRCNYGMFYTDYNQTADSFMGRQPQIDFVLCISDCSIHSSFKSICQEASCCISPMPDGARSILYTVTSDGKPGDCGGFSIPFYPFAPTDWQSTYALKLIWALPYNETSDYRHVGTDPGNFCSDYSNVTYSWGVPGYTCTCLSGYEGDGYRHGIGCKDIDECKDPALNRCVPGRGICHNTEGGYNCSCRSGKGDGYRDGTGCVVSTHVEIAGIVGGCAGAVVIFMAIAYALRRRHLRLKKQRNFLRNGGFQLREMIISTTCGRQRAQLFSLDDLKAATGGFASWQRLGAGAYGTVFKGTLKDGRMVAIKRANHSNSTDTQQFLNEVAILTQINHRHIVSLLGCCVETDVPLLVYEYVSNGTLAEHLRGGRQSCLIHDWSRRLTIAIQTAEALAYLHSAASPPILHRDVKSLNILLDNKLDAKLADFGASRLLLRNIASAPGGTQQQHSTRMDDGASSPTSATALHGTFGYLDPEYLQSFHLTDKSDVYSFGVVLAELITGLKPVAKDSQSNLINLAQVFLNEWTQQQPCGNLDGMAIDTRIAQINQEDTRKAITRVAELTARCLRMKGEDRPSMKDVVEELHWIRAATCDHKFKNDDESEPLLFSEPINQVVPLTADLTSSSHHRSYGSLSSLCIESVFQSGR